jgi:predicted GNAT family acetyltransferase
VPEIDIRAYARTAVAHGLPDLPWQIPERAAMQLSPPYRAFALDGAQILISNPEASTIAIQGLVVPAELRGAGRAQRLVARVIAQFPGKAWRIPALCPEEFAGFWQKMGFTVGRLSQFQMELMFAQ